MKRFLTRMSLAFSIVVVFALLGVPEVGVGIGTLVFVA